jgi:hypothetical protein
MGHVILRFYGPLNDFLPRSVRHRPLVRPLARRVSIKDLVESMGPPHPEIILLLVDGVPVPFSHLVVPPCRISAYPHCYALDLTGLSEVLPEPLAEPRFVVDGHLGRLAAYLRALGYDTAFDPTAADQELAERTRQRILLTRDVGLLKRKCVTHGYWVRATEREEQLEEVAGRFDLGPRARPFSRCVTCNGLLAPVDKAEVVQLVPPRVRERQEAFRRCTACGQVFWRGSHHDRMSRLIARLGVSVS